MENIINSGNLIIEKYELLEEHREHFNIFEILDIERKEVELHSKFIYGLLNFKRNKKLRNKIIELFFQEVLKENFDKNENYEITREQNAGENGRIDFYIECKLNNKGIAIEMKIDAQDGENQLKKYESYLKKRYKENYSLFYLNIFGTEPSQYSIDSKTKYKIISFKKNIINWIKKILEIAYDYTMLRETLKQYLMTLNKLSKNMEDNKKMELKELLLKKNNLRVIEELQSTAEELRNDIEIEFWKELREKIKIDLDIFDEFNLIKLNEWKDGKEIFFYKDINLNNNFLTFGLGREKNGKIYFIIGIREIIKNEWNTKKIIKTNQNIKENLEKIGKNLSSAYWENFDKFNIKSEDIYILIEEDKKNEKQLLINNCIEKFKCKYELINRLFS